MMKRTTFVADSCTLVLWGSFFHLASPGHIVKRLVLLSLSLLISVYFLFVCLFLWLSSCPPCLVPLNLRGRLRQPGHFACMAQTGWADQPVLSLVRISVSRARFCVLLLFRSNQNDIVTLLDPPSPVPCNTARWSDIMLSGDKQGQDLPPCHLQRPSLPLKPQGLNGTFTERKTNRRKLLTSTSFFSYFCVTGCF